MMLFLLNAGADPNEIYHGESIFIRLLANCRPRHTIKLLLDHGANPNSRTRYCDDYALDVCDKEIELLLVRYGGTESRYWSNLYTNAFLIIDIMLYGTIQEDWTICIKGYIY
jgi:hypothetical protein